MLSKEKRQLVAEILRRGGTLLAEPCPKCGGILVRYKGRTFCPNCDNINSIEDLEAKAELRPAELKDIEDMIKQRLAAVLKNEADEEKASRIALNYANALKALRELGRKNEG
ncbi:MAG: Sjogren's syndrome/scleroderma autoantigen 1 family protein [Nitrososphaeria archaeon]